MTVGQGFIALAITMIGGWNPWKIAFGAILFGMLNALGDSLQIIGVGVRTEFIGMFPYIGIMIAMIVLARRTASRPHWGFRMREVNGDGCPPSCHGHAPDRAPYRER